ncbi:hypothetical protein [Clostridium sp.]|uniref:hypothetical protein n=1 Tax=Clostridium sp. TaxID=1506 RepID=UPI003D6DA313
MENHRCSTNEITLESSKQTEETIDCTRISEKFNSEITRAFFEVGDTYISISWIYKMTKGQKLIPYGFCNYYYIIYYC